MPLFHKLKYMKLIQSFKQTAKNQLRFVAGFKGHLDN